jgi:hypothetical protein
MANNIITAKVHIRGTRPLWWHVFGPDALPLEKQEKTGVPGNDPTEWKKTVTFTKNGQLYLRGDYIFSCLRDAARYTKAGRGSIQKMVAATLQIVDERVLIEDRFIPGFNGGLPDTIPDDPDLPVYLDVRGVRNPSTKGRNIRYRVACSTGWECSFTIQWDKTIVDRGQMQAVAIDAGKLCGLADGRSIGYGRFDILSFEIEGY